MPKLPPDQLISRTAHFQHLTMADKNHSNDAVNPKETHAPVGSAKSEKRDDRQDRHSGEALSMPAPQFLEKQSPSKQIISDAGVC